jgi:hypothetical protein
MKQDMVDMLLCGDWERLEGTYQWNGLAHYNMYQILMSTRREIFELLTPHYDPLAKGLDRWTWNPAVECASLEEAMEKAAQHFVSENVALKLSSAS